VRVNWFSPIEKEENIVGLRWYEHTHPAGLSKSEVYIYIKYPTSLRKMRDLKGKATSHSVALL